MTAYANFQFFDQDRLTEASDVFCAMIELINPLAEITVKEQHSERGTVIGMLIFVEGMSAKEIDHLKTVAIKTANRRVMNFSKTLAGVN